MKPTKPEQPSAREHWSQAPASTRANIEHLLGEARRHGGRASLAFVRGCMARGYDCSREELASTTKIINEMDAAATAQAKARVAHAFSSLDVLAEKQAIDTWTGASITGWRSTSLAQQEADRKARAEAERRAEAVKTRAAEILIENQRAAERAALAQAEKEIA